MSNIKESVEQVPSLVEGVKEMLSKLKEKFFTETELKFTDAKLKDGTIVSWDGDNLEAGVPLFVIDESGQRLPAPDMEYVLEDGTAITVMNGVVSEIKPNAAPSEEPKATEEMAEPNATAAPAPAPVDVKSIVESVIKETRFVNEDYEGKFVAIEKENTELKDKVNQLTEMLKETFAVVEKIASQPSEAPKPKRDGFMVSKTLSEREKEIEEFRKNYLTN